MGKLPDPKVDPSSAPAESAKGTCPCGRLDETANKMVGCERCKRSYHSLCADMHDANDRSFICPICIDRPKSTTASRSGKSTTSSFRAAKTALALQQLEEEKEIEERDRLQREKAAEEKVRIEKEYVAKKYELLQAQIDEQEVAGSLRSRRSSRGRQRVEDWLQNQPLPVSTTSNGCPQIPAGLTSRTGTVPKGTFIVPTTCTAANVVHSEQQAQVSTPNEGMFDQAVGGSTLISPDVHARDPSAPVDLIISPMQTPDELTKQWYDMQRRMAVIQQQMQRTYLLPKLHQPLEMPPQHQQSTVHSQKRSEIPEHQVKSPGTELEKQQIQQSPYQLEIQQPQLTLPPTTPLQTLIEQHQGFPQIQRKQKQDERQGQQQFQQHLQQVPSICGAVPQMKPSGPANFSSFDALVHGSRFELPSSVHHAQTISSVSQTCSNYTTTTTSQIYSSQSKFETIPPNTSTFASIIHSTLPYTTEPSPPPSLRQVTVSSFGPLHMSTPEHTNSSAPSVHTVSSHLSPIVSPNVQQSTSSFVPRQLFSGPSSQQLAARHVVPRDLPSFSGDPVEWPLFLSSYQNSTEMCGYSEGENLMRLQRSIKGNALEAVRSHLMYPSSVPLIVETLRTLYGRPELIINSLLGKVRSTPAPKPEKLETLINFGLACQNLCVHLQAAGLTAHLSNPTLLQELVEKLPANIRLDWPVFKRQFPTSDLNTFGNYMANLVKAASDVTFSSESNLSQSFKHDRQKRQEKMYVNAHVTEEPEKQNENQFEDGISDRKENFPRPCPICQKTGHKAKDCHLFRGMTLKDRWASVQDRHLCRRCLVSHGRYPCKAALCGVDGCEDRHHKLLHPGRPELPPKSSDGPITTSTVTLHRQLQHSIMFRIIPVTLYGNGKSIDTFAFLDDGSSTTLMDARIADELGVKGDIHPICLQWTGEVERIEENSQMLSLDISGSSSMKRYFLKEVHTVRSLNLPVQSLNYEKLCLQHQYLRGLPVQSYDAAVPTILIGLDNTNLKVTLKLREGRKDEPVATKTRLGWTIYGQVPGGTVQSVHSQLHICSRSLDVELHNLVKEFFTIEHAGVAVVSLLESDDDRRARGILEKTTLRTSSGRFQTGLLWKYDYVDFPNSRPMAERRMKCLERRLSSKPELYENVRKQIEDYERKGYAHKATRNELVNSDPKRTWYLPLGVVVNPRKPTKVRLVWDAAAKVAGQSFNSALLAGPDLLSSLPSVLCKYRQREVAICGDIKEMFHQIQVQAEDKQAQRFLWRKHPSEPVDVYVMDVATFGSTCSPCAAQFVKNQNAKEYADQYPRAAIAITKNHYVDDYLDSLDTVEEAVKLANEVKLVHSKAGFEIRNRLSNSKDVLSRVGEQKAESIKSFKAGNAVDQERVLGMIWLPEKDVFAFDGLFRKEIKPLLEGDIIPTKRQLLRVVMSIFDPLGFVAVFVIHGKILIQNVWRAKIGWDERLSMELFEQWRRWISLLQQLNQVEIPRCYFPGYYPKSYDTLELHVFVDAAEDAYACVSYFRIVDKGEVRCCLVSAKTKVAPLKPLSIPRMELQAAVIGARMADDVTKNHTLKIIRRVLWTDSKVTLAWLQSDQRKYRLVVGCKVTEILDLTDISEWHWVPSRWNVADEATKWGKGPVIDRNSRWFTGPEFLYQPSSAWPQQETASTETTEELRPVHVHRATLKAQLVEFGRFSKWERVVRSVAYVHRFIDILKRKANNVAGENPDGFEKNELVRAETTVWKQIQLEAYEDEIVTMRRNQQLPLEQQSRLEKTSKINKLSPFLDQQGVIRMDTRIAPTANLPQDFKFPVILPKNNYGTQLVVDWYHRNNNHINNETALNEMRQKFYISEFRAAFKNARKHCMWCTVYKAYPTTPRMAPLPLARTTPYVRAFSYVGIDYFGPLLIKQCRSEVKRWVALFTCLTIRAVHLEGVFSLSAESCKMAIRRFIARRGAPAEIYSDRGTNFVGASRELEQEIRGINEALATTFTNTVTQWRFNPPSSPHMGGSWERMVRSVKCALASLSTVRKPNDETFVTILIEAESIVNSRPLTYMPIESTEHEALTPNCFLMLSTSGVNQPTRMPVEEKYVVNSNWNLYQYLLDQFWRRWIKEYLPTITKRTKWFKETGWSW